VQSVLAVSSEGLVCCVGIVTHKVHSADCETLAPAGSCHNHRVIAHDAEGLERWCQFCGKDDEGVKIKRGTGGWGT
jgi:hypothetical protein